MTRHLRSTVLWTMICLTTGTRAAMAAEPLVLEGHENVVSSIAFSTDGTQLYSGSWDKSVRVWNLPNGNSRAVLVGHRDWVLAVALAAEKRQLVSASQRAIRVWDATTFELTEEYGGLGGANINSVAFSHDGTLLVAGGRDGRASLWHVGESSPRTVYAGFESWVSSLAIASDNQSFAAGTRTGRIRLFDATSADEIATLVGDVGPQVLCLAFNPTGDALAAGSFDGSVKIWEPASGEQTATLSGHKGIVTAIAWSADGQRLATGERHGQIKLWNVAEGYRLIDTLKGHSDDRLGFSVTALAFSPAGSAIASGGYDKRIKVWPLPND